MWAAACAGGRFAGFWSAAGRPAWQSYVRQGPLCPHYLWRCPSLEGRGLCILTSTLEGGLSPAYLQQGFILQVLTDKGPKQDDVLSLQGRGL